MNELTELANKYLTDKGTEFDGKHNFTEVYHKKLKHLKNKKLNILEIGILEGASAKMWRDYFTKSKIYCCDNNPEYVRGVLWEDRIFPFLLDQSSKLNILESINDIKCKEYDIIIDDGSHNVKHQQQTFGLLFQYLKKGGIYIIEDLHTSLNPNYRDLDMSYEDTTLHMFKKYQDEGKWESKFILKSDLKILKILTKEVKVFGWENLLNKEKMSITSMIWKN